MKNSGQRTTVKNRAFDTIIIGGGAAGMSAALWCGDLGLNALLLESAGELGGQLLRVYNPIKNHLGAETENGRRLRDIFLKQIENFRFSVKLDSKVCDVDLKMREIFLENGEAVSGEALIIATGVRRRKLNVEGEREFINHGIIESGKRDAALLSGKRVCIVGGGDAALENALILAETSERIYLVHRSDKFRARTEFIETARSNKKIKFLTETIVSKIDGKETVKSVSIKNLRNGATTVLAVDAVLLRIGVEPNTEIYRGKLKLDKSGYVEIDSRCRTNAENVFAVGDVANPASPTVSSAVGMGATAAKAIFEALNR